jgi:hypothetical protein
MTDQAGEILDGLGNDFPLHVDKLSLLDQALTDFLGTAFRDSAFFEVFIDTEGDAVLVEVSFVSDPLVLTIPGLSTFSLSVGKVDEIELEVAIVLDNSGARCSLFDAPLFLQCPNSDLLTPVVKNADKWEPDVDSDGAVKKVALVFSGISLEIDFKGSFDATADVKVDLQPVRIGKSGVVVAMKGLRSCLSDQAELPAGVPAGSRGFSIETVEVYLPDSIQGIPFDEIEGDGLFIGSGGFTGKLSLKSSSQNKTIHLGGIECNLISLEFDIKQNSFVRSELKCQLTLPYFDQPVILDVAFSGDGSLLASLSAVQPQGVTYDNGLIQFEKENVFKVTIEGVSFELKDGISTLTVSGKIQPLFQPKGGQISSGNETAWPVFDIRGLSIDSEGHVKFAGGWMDLPDQYALDFHGFKIEITQLGFGKTDGGGKWIGFSGGLKLVDGFKAGASVEGLRITWYPDGRDTKITLNGVGVEFEIPDVVRFKGDVSYREFEQITPTGDTEIVHRFDGDIELNLISLNLEIDATLVVGSATGPLGTYTFFAIYVDVELPTGIPLASTGVALYGFAGLFALQMEPNKTSTEEWYDGWYKRDKVGVTDLKKKWQNTRGSRAFGAGVTIGTQSDNGFTFAGTMLLVIVFPGPIILIEGKANLLKERAKLLVDEPTFRSLAVIDDREKTLQIGLDAFYKTDETGSVIEIRAGTEAFFDFKDASRWHIYLGEREPRDKRIQADIFKIFKANSYFMIDAHQLATGAWLGYSKAYKFGPLKVSLEAWIEGNAVVSWKPLHFYGDLWMHGSAELSVFGFGLGLTADARFAADVFDPFHVKGELSVGIKVPLRKKPLEADLTFEWGPRPGRPPLPLPLKEIAIEHFKVTTTWPLERGKLLLPIYDTEVDGFFPKNAFTNTQGNEPPAPNLPIVPMDCRPHISFGRTVHDSALIGVNAQPVIPARERIGDPAKNEGPISIRYSLDEIALSKWNEPGWQLVARKSTDANPAGVRTIFGSWAPIPSLPAGNVSPGTDPPVSNSKLWLWSLTPFDYTRHSGDDLNNWFVKNFPHYPCTPKLSEREICCDFERIDRTQQIRSPLKCLDHPEISLEWFGSDFTVGTILEQPTRGDFISVTILKQPIRGLTHALCFPRRPPEPVFSATSLSLEGRRRRTNNEIVRAEIDLGLTAGSTAAIRLSEPATRVTIVVTQEQVSSPTNINFRDAEADTGPNPRFEQGVRFDARDSGARPVNETRIGVASTTRGPLMGLKCEQQLEITLPCASAFVQLTLTHYLQSDGPVPTSSAATVPAPPVTIRAFNEDGTIADTRNTQSPEHTAEAIRLTGNAITRVVIGTIETQPSALGAGPTPTPLHEVWLHALWFDCSGAASSFATGFDNQRNSYGPFPAKDHLIEVAGKNITLVQIQSNGEICILQVCATIPPDPAEVDARDKMAKNLVDQMTRWSESAEVLEPHTTYRLKVATSLDTEGNFQEIKQQVEYAYFRTGGPPGLTQLTPTGPGKTENLDSGLNDLSRYVRQTTPATVPAVGDKPVMAKPFYRAYDIGVEFNERYVDLMYRMDGRDLGLYLYDNNNRPARDVNGRLIIANNAWGTTEEVTLTESEALWIKLINQSHCDPGVSIALSGIPHNKTLTSASEGQVLAGDTIYEARLVPLLLHDIFTGYSVGARAQGPSGSLGPWSVFDSGSNNGPSHWEVREEGTPPGRFIIQTSSISGGASDPKDPVKPGAVLVLANRRELTVDSPDQPSNWTDYRLSAYLRSATDGAIGLVFRYVDADHYYRFSMDRQGQYRRVVSVGVVNGEKHTRSLAEDGFAYDQNRDYLITVEAIGPALRVYQDGALVFDVNDASIEHGSVGLYCGSNTGARFSDVRVDDFRKQAPTVYSFKFTTSLFTDFFHHLHSFQDETWIVKLGSLAGVQSLVAQAALPATLPLEAEARAYDALAELVLGPSARQNPPQVEVTRVEHGGEALALLVRSPEPINWTRTDLVVLHAAADMPKPALPGAVKLIDITFGVTHPNEESVTLLLREATDLTGYRIEYLSLPELLEPIGDDQPVLLGDHFADGDTSGWTIVDEGTDQGPSSWSAFEGAFRQTSNINTPSPRKVLSKKGTQAVAGDPAWTDFIVSTKLRSLANGALGLLFRYAGTDNYYRFSMDSQQAYRRLVKNVGGTFNLLWGDGFAYEVGRAYKVTIVAIGGTLRGYLDGAPMFEIVDNDLAAGRIGLYCYGDTDARFSEVRVASPAWTTYYDFGKESRMPAGARVRVFAGAEADAPAADQGVVRRFVAPAGEPGRLRLPADGADLRLRAPGAIEGHERRFLPGGVYSPVDARLLRKGDGTGFLVIVPAGSPAGSALAVGPYRLGMKYRRNNRAIDPGSQLLTEAGNRSDENVTIDIPW